MKLLQAIQSLGVPKSLKCAKEFSAGLNLDWDADVKFVFSVIAHNEGRVPGNISGDTEQQAIKKWLEKYKGGYDSRASQRVSNPPAPLQILLSRR